MHPSTLLEDFGNLLPWNLSRRRCFVSMIFGVFTSASVQQHKMARGFRLHESSHAKNDSICTRIRNFFRDFTINEGEFAQALIKTTGLKGPYTLALDRTNWKFGGLHINFLVLAVVVNNTVAFPIFWTLLPKAGNSNSTERIHILQSFIDLFGSNMIHEITADREFIGKVWIDFLIQNTIPFCIRIKENRLVDWGTQTKSIRCFFKHLNGRKSRFMEVNLDGHRLFFQGALTPTGELIIVMSNQDRSRNLLKKYKKRWTIELLFKNLKSNGFNLEETHMRHLERLHKLFAVVTMAFILAFLTGKQQEKIYKTPYKKTVRAPLFSTFRRGFDWIRQLIDEGKNKVIKHFQDLFGKIIR